MNSDKIFTCRNCKKSYKKTKWTEHFDESIDPKTLERTFFPLVSYQIYGIEPGNLCCKHDILSLLDRKFIIGLSDN